MINPNCETCPFIKVCGEIDEAREAMLQELTIRDAQTIIADTHRSIRDEKLGSIEAAITELSPDFQNDPELISLKAREDQLNAKDREYKSAFHIARTSLINQIVIVKREWGYLSNRAQESCKGPRERKNYLIFGKKTVACTSAIGRANYEDAVIVYISSIESLDKLKEPLSQ